MADCQTLDETCQDCISGESRCQETGDGNLNFFFLFKKINYYCFLRKILLQSYYYFLEQNFRHKRTLVVLGKIF